MTIRAILASKGGDVVSVSSSDLVSDALALLAEKRIGAVPVIDEGHVVGIFSERDIIYSLAKSGAASAEGVICLAIEEPELFQHPIQAQAFAKVLRSLAEDGDKRIQVTYATHSPYFLEARHFNQVRRLTRSSNTMPLVTVHFAAMDEIKAKLNGVMSADAVERKLDSIVANELAVALFANRAFLVEGATESSVFYGISDKKSPGSLETTGVSIVPVGGKSMIPLAYAILTSMGIPVYALFDADAGFEVRAKANGKHANDIEKERNDHVRANRKMLNFFGQTEVDFPSAIVAENVAIFDDHLESFLAENWPEWFASCNAVEAAAGITLKKNQLAYRIATLKAEGVVPDLLMQILIKAEGK